jgi:uroporphyrinogen-III synthase
VVVHRLATPEAELDRGPLTGLGVIVTRPARQAAGLAHKLAALGAEPLIWPAIAILPPVDTRPLASAHERLASYDAAVFVSANAVEYGAPGNWPSKVLVFAPGPGTAEALANVGIRNVRVPTTTFDSEGLLALPELQAMSGKRVVIFRGEGGRDYLAEMLRAGGAHVDCIPCYVRAAPQSSAEGLRAALRDGRAHALSLTSREGVDNLIAALGKDGIALAAQIPSFAPHARITAHAREHGLATVTTAAGEAGLIAGLLEWFTANPRTSAKPT